jgi:hypothetical protein
MTTGLARPTYQNALRAIGRYLDRKVYRHVLVSEVADGYIVRAGVVELTGGSIG